MKERRMFTPALPSFWARQWLRFGRLLVWLILTALLLGALGWALATAWYAWKFSGPVSALEQVPEGEAAMTQDIIQTAVILKNGANHEGAHMLLNFILSDKVQSDLETKGLERVK